MKIPPLLREAMFRRYWQASTISLLGDQVSGIAIPLTAVLTLHASAAQMGYLAALMWLPSLLFGMHLGAWVDRMGRRLQMMVVADVGRAVIWASVPVCYGLNVLSLPLLYVMTFLGGTLSMLFMVANSALFVAIVPEADYVDGQSLMNTSRGATQIVGPSLGGMLVNVLSGPAAVVLDALSFLGSAAFLGRIKVEEPLAADPENSSITEGARFIKGNSTVRALLSAMVPMNFSFFLFEAVYMLYAVRGLHIKPYVLGVILSLAAVGGLLGSTLTKRIARKIGIGRAYVLACLTLAVSLFLWPIASGPMWLIVIIVFLSEVGLGFGVLLLDTSSGSIWAVAVPDTMKARVTGVFQAASLGTRPAGALLGGILGTAIGLRSTLLVGAIGTLIGGLLLLPSPVPRFRMPETTAAEADLEAVESM